MNQEKEQYKDVAILEEMEALRENLHLEIQKSISLSNLGVGMQESFSHSLTILDDMAEKVISIKDITVKLVASTLLRDSVELLSKKIEQVK